ncbi:MAG TPA: hypothetical protein VJ302_10875 [Blastocatellia bacterium]|nr:hypothetical protein [Blastocatellia bacterium]
MSWWHELKYLIRKLDRRRAEREPEEEIRTHLELETREQLEDGLSPKVNPTTALRQDSSIKV